MSAPRVNIVREKCKSMFGQYNEATIVKCIEMVAGFMKLLGMVPEFDVIDLGEQLEITAEKMKNVHDENIQLAAAVTTLKTAAVETSEEHKKQLEGLNKTVEDRDNKIKELEKNEEALALKVDMLEDEKEKLEEDKASLTSKLAEAGSDNSKLAGELAAAQLEITRLRTIEAEYVKLGKTVAGLQEVLNEKSDEIRALCKVKDQLENVIKAQSSNVASYVEMMKIAVGDGDKKITPAVTAPTSTAFVFTPSPVPMFTPPQPLASPAPAPSPMSPPPSPRGSSGSDSDDEPDSSAFSSAAPAATSESMYDENGDLWPAYSDELKGLKVNIVAKDDVCDFLYKATGNPRFATSSFDDISSYFSSYKQGQYYYRYKGGLCVINI